MTTSNNKPQGPMPLHWWLLLIALGIGLVGTFFLWYWPGPQHRSQDQKFRPEFVVIQLNDIYRIDAVQDGKKGGLGRIATLVKQLKQQNQKVLIVHAGDFLQPSLESTRFKGLQMIAALNYLNSLAPLVVVPGNHEFDKKDAKVLVDAVNESEFTWLAANLALQYDNATAKDASAAGSFDRAKAKVERDKQQEIITIGKMRVGIFALTLDNAQDNDQDQAYAPIDGNYASIAESRIKDLEQKGADIIVGLTHLDIDDDMKLAKLRSSHPRFMWLAGGHEHYWQREKLSESSALITKGDSNARSVWKVAVGYRNGQPAVAEERIEVDEKIEPDAAYHRDIEEYYHAKLEKEVPHLDQPIANVNQIVQNGKCLVATEEAVRNQESNWGSFIADQMRTAFPGVKKADIAFINGGSLRIDDVMCNEISLEDLERTFAYETHVVFVELRGADIKDKILSRIASSKFGDGSFLQVSGLQYRFDRKTKTLGDVNVEDKNGWKSLDEKRLYTVAVPEYLLNCEDKYHFRESITKLLPVIGPNLESLVYEALTRQGPTNASVAAQTISRISELPVYLIKTAGSKNQKVNWIKAAGDFNDCKTKIRKAIDSIKK
jgi:2',3'-cyclic-nucleotide 2'-phosphodiesterase (5'-nucleotidase family)